MILANYMCTFEGAKTAGTEKARRQDNCAVKRMCVIFVPGLPPHILHGMFVTLYKLFYGVVSKRVPSLNGVPRCWDILT